MYILENYFSFFGKVRSKNRIGNPNDIERVNFWRIFLKIERNRDKMKTFLNNFFH